jgi:hypothetical protein
MRTDAIGHEVDVRERCPAREAEIRQLERGVNARDKGAQRLGLGEAALDAAPDHEADLRLDEDPRKGA